MINLPGAPTFAGPTQVPSKECRQSNITKQATVTATNLQFTDIFEFHSMTTNACNCDTELKNSTKQNSNQSDIE